VENFFFQTTEKWEVPKWKRIVFLETYVSRLKGLLAKSRLPFGTCYAFPRTRLLHTFGMKFSIDVFFLDASGELLVAFLNVPPGKIVVGPARTYWALEAAAGSF
jgi:uncharacterized protein